MQFISSVNQNTLPQAIFFDLDGTLIDSARDLAAAVNLMLNHYHLPEVELSQVSAWIGNGAAKLVERALNFIESEGHQVPKAAEALEQFFAAYSQIQGQHSHLYPQVEETLRYFHQAKVKMAVITNKPKQFTPEVLRAHGIDQFFDLVLSGDSLAEKKPSALPLQHALQHFSLSPEDVIMVGDSASDISAANSAGVASVCVTYGYNHGNDPRELPAKAHIDQFSDLSQ